MSDGLTFGVKLEGSGNLAGAARDARDELAALKKTTDELAVSSGKMAGQYSGLDAAVKQHSAAVTETAGNVNKLLDRYDPLGAKLRQLQADFKALDAAAAGGKIAGRDDARVDLVYQKIQQEIGAATSAAQSFGNVAAGKSDEVAWATARARQEFMVLGREIASGNYSRIPSTLSIIAQGLSPVALGVAAVTTAVAAGAYAWSKWGDDAESAVERARAATTGMRDSDAVFLLQQEKETLGRLIPPQWLAYNARELKSLDKDSQELIAEYRELDKQLQNEIKRNNGAWESLYATAAERKASEVKKIEQLYREQLLIHKGKAKELEEVEAQHRQKLADLDEKYADKPDKPFKPYTYPELTAYLKGITREEEKLKKEQWQESKEWLKEEEKKAKALDETERGLYDRRAEVAGAAAKKIADAQQKEAERAAQSWERFTGNVQRNLGDVLYNGLNGKFDGIADMFAQMLLRMQADAAAAKLTEALFPTGGGGLTGFLGGLFGSKPTGLAGMDQSMPIMVDPLASANGNVFSGDGIGAFSGQIVNRPTLFPFARGIGLMGEAGPEAIMPLRRDSSGRLGVSAQSGGGVVVNIIESPGNAGQVRQRDEGGINIIDVFVASVKSAIASDITRGSGDIPAALSRTYGMNRAAGSY